MGLSFCSSSASAFCVLLVLGRSMVLLLSSQAAEGK